ncbi:MAG: DUF58 domain-containing protein [Gemmatimonadetes bacterium]|nr:DUF58 domain-containing protein [Gemmatimonadota bacterium]
MTDAAAGARRAPPAEILRQVRRLELTARGLVNAAFAGEYRSVFTGSGMEFAEVREYQPGDEVRTIDWNVTARMGRPFVRRYVEERERTVMVAVDGSASSRFATAGRFKHELAAEFAAVVALCAIRSNDRIGGLLFTDHIEHLVPPAKGRRHALRLVRDLLAVEPTGRGTNLAIALDALTGITTHRAIVFVLSDFDAEGYEGALSRLARRHDTIAVPVEDPAERLLPDAGIVRFVDPERGIEVEADTSDPRVREAFAERACAKREARSATFRRVGVDEIAVRTDRGYTRELLAFFRRRLARRGGRSR